MTSTDTTTTTDTAALPLSPGTWTVDHAHSSITFSIRHLGLAKVRGRFGRFEAEVLVGDTLERSSLRATVDMTSIDTGIADRDAHISTPEFLDVERFPTMAFVSSAIRADGGDRYVVTGDLTVHGVTRTVDLPVELNGVAHVMGQTKAGFTVSHTVRRSDHDLGFGMPVGEALLGDKVAFEIDIQLVAPDDGERTADGTP